MSCTAFSGLYAQDESSTEEEREMYVIVEGSSDAVVLETEERWSRSLGSLRLDQKVIVLDPEELKDEKRTLIKIRTVLGQDTVVGWVKRAILSDEVTTINARGSEGAARTGGTAVGAIKANVMPSADPIPFDDILRSHQQKNKNSKPNIDIISITGTGKTSGPVLTMKVKNNTNTPVKTTIGRNAIPTQYDVENNNNGDLVLIKTGKKHQDYIVTGPGSVTLPPDEETDIPLTGVCISPNLPPLPEGKPIKINNNITSYPIPVTSDTPITDFKVIDTDSNKPVVNPIISVSPLPSSGQSIYIPSGKGDDYDNLIVAAVSRIDSTIEEMDTDGHYYTGIFKDGVPNHKDVIRQFTTWIYIGILTDDNYDQDDIQVAIEKETKSQGIKIESEDIKNQASFIYDQSIHTELKAGVISYTPVITQEAERRQPVISNEDPGCDTIRQKASAMLELSAKMLCQDVSPILNALDKLFSKYAGALDELAELRGRSDAIDQFKDDIETMKDDVVSGLKKEIEDKEGMNSEDEDCGGDWKANMINRFGDSKGTQRRIQNTERAFEQAKNSQLKELNKRLERQEKYWDDIAEPLNEQAEATGEAISELEEDIESIKKELDDLIAELLKNVCDFKILWEDLLRFMEANYQCLDCPQEILEPPPIIQQLNDCLKDLLKALEGLKNHVPLPGDEEMAQKEAKSTFDREGALEKFKEVREAIDRYNEHIATGGGATMVSASAECKRLLTRSSGYQFFGGINRPQTSSGDIGRTYGTMGGRTVAGPSNPSSMSNSSDRRTYRRERNEYRAEAAKLAREVNRTVRSAKRGHNGEPIEEAFADEGNVNAHGKTKAIPYKEDNQKELNKLIDKIIDDILKCYNKNLAQQQQTRYYELVTKCLIFRQCGLAVATTYGDYKRLLDSLQTHNDHKVDQLRRELEHLKRSRDRLSNRISDVEKEIRDIGNEIDKVGSGTTGSNSDAARSARRALNKRMAEQRDAMKYLRRHRDNINSQINNINTRLNRVQRQSDNLSRARGMSTLRDIDDCERELERMENLKERITDTQDGQIDPAIEDIEKDFEGAYEDVSSGFDEASRISDGITGIGNDGANIHAELNEIELAKQASIALRRRINCEILLAEHYNRNRPRGTPEIDIEDLKDEIDNISEFLKDLQELTKKLQNANEDINAILDEINKKAGQLLKGAKKVKEVLEFAESVATILDGLGENATPDQRARAFGEVINHAENLAGKVPGFGDMITYYSKAYQAAINAILAIGDEMIEPFFEAAESFINRQPCHTIADNAGDMTLDEIIEDMYQRFVNSIGGDTVLGAGLRGVRNREKFRAMFMAEAQQYIIECCIFK